MTPLVGIRANAGASVGLGHIKRCQSLAEALLALGARVVFLVNPESGAREWLPAGAAVEELAASEAATLADTSNLVERHGMTALVVDSYDIGPTALERVQIPTAAIVDVPPIRPLPVALVINGAAGAAGQHHPLAAGSRALLGPEFVLLQRAFESGRAAVGERVERLLITTGGGDDRGLCLRLLSVVRRALSHVRIAVVAGNYFPQATVHALEQLAASEPGIKLVTSAPTLYPLMMEADLAITTGGQTTYELAATGTPACGVVLADNQYPNLRTLSLLGTLEWVGSIRDPDLESRLERQLVVFASDTQRRQAMSRAGQRLVDGKGAGRVAREILGLCG